MKFGVGVEGPSDQHFWTKVLNKHFAPHQFNVWTMNNRVRLIRETPRLLETFRNAHYDGVFILADKDKERCLSDLRTLFDEPTRKEFLKQRPERYLNLCAPIRNVEAWYQADEAGIRLVIEGTDYVVPPDTDGKGKGTIKSLYSALYGNQRAYNEIDFAEQLAPKFDPQGARQHSTSFNYFWTRLEEVTA